MKPARLPLTVLLSFCWLPLLSGCQGSEKPASQAATAAPAGQLQIVCTTGQVEDILVNIGGERVAVESLMGPGVDPHLYKATLGDTKKLKRADAVFYSGLHLEGRLAEVLESLGRNKPVCAVAEILVEKSSDRLRKPAQFQGFYDPHIWFDVSMWSECAGYAGESLAKLDTTHADEIIERTNKYVDELKQLDQWCRDELASVPKEQRVLVTAHDAFGYLGLAYDVEVHGLQGISTADEADLASINSIVQLLVARKIKAVFVESSVPPKNIKSLIEGCAAQGHTVVEGGELFSDAMGQPGTPEGTYAGMIRHNINTIVKALK